MIKKKEGGDQAIAVKTLFRDKATREVHPGISGLTAQASVNLIETQR